MRGSVNTSTNNKETITSGKVKKVKRRQVEKIDHEHHALSMEQINIITPNAPGFDTKDMARNSSI